MAFKKTYRKRPAKKCDAKCIKKVVNKVLAKRTELKYRDGGTTLTSGLWDYSGVINPLSDIPVGTDDRSRIGDSVTGYDLEVKSLFNLGPLTTNGSTCRQIIFRWKAQSTIDVLVPDKILLPGYVGNVFAPIASYNHDNRSKFEVLSDKTIQLYGGSSGNRFMKHSVKLRNKKINYYGGLTTDQMNGLYVLTVCDNVAAASPNVEIKSHIRYTDM